MKNEKNNRKPTNKNKGTKQLNSDTKIIDTNKINKKANSKKKNNKNKIIMKRVLIIFVILVIIGAGVLAGVLFGLFGDKFAITKQKLIVNYSNSTIVDEDGNLLATLSAKENRKMLTKSEMGDYLPKAFVSIEDERFYKHHGVDIKRTGAAVLTFLFHKGESSFGGSTITQQLVKNITNEKDDSGTAGAVRKIKEMIRAYQVEMFMV